MKPCDTCGNLYDKAFILSKTGTSSASAKGGADALISDATNVTSHLASDAKEVVGKLAGEAKSEIEKRRCTG